MICVDDGGTCGLGGFCRQCPNLKGENMRKIIQITETQDTEYSQGFFTALCDDGTLWNLSAGKWSIITPLIPQDEINETK